MKNLLEIKELAEERGDFWLEKAEQEPIEKLLKLKGYKLRELRIKELYNLRYREEKEGYLRKLEAKKAYLNLLN